MLPLQQQYSSSSSITWSD